VTLELDRPISSGEGRTQDMAELLSQVACTDPSNPNLQHSSGELNKWDPDSVAVVCTPTAPFEGVTLFSIAGA